MSDLISRSAVLEMFAKYKFGAINSDVEREYIKETIPLLVNSVPTVEVIPKEKLDEIVERLEKQQQELPLKEWRIINEAIETVKEVGGMND